jgi:hypothetical protein
MHQTANFGWMILATLLLTGCDQVAERAGFPLPATVEADGKAIGSGCRHAGRGLEDCYRLNKDASKAAVYAGWREMNEYMVKNNMATVTPLILPEQLAPPKPKKKKKVEGEEGESSEGDETGKAKTDANTDADTEAKPADDAEKKGAGAAAGH